MAPKWDESFEAPWYGLPDNTGVCEVQPVVNAWLTLQCAEIIDPQDEETIRVPSIAFLITHESGRRVLFDFGVSCSWTAAYKPEIGKALEAEFQTGKIEHEMAQVLEQSGVELKSIESIVISHRHWDHVGNPATIKDSNFLLTSEEADNLKISIPESQVKRVEFGSRKVAAFEGSYDIFGDGSCCLVPMLGHTSGHTGCVVRTKERTYALAADSCHSPKIIQDAKYRMSLYGEHKDESFYEDYDEASRTVIRLRQCEAKGVTVLLAHDPDRWKTWSKDKVGVGAAIA